jgi:hypothetical protein
MADPTFQIPKDIIQPIIQASVNEAVLRALDGPSNVVSKAILAVINTMVDENGKPSSYNSSRPWIDWVIGDCIKVAAKAAVLDALAKYQPQMQAELVKQLTGRRSPLIRQLAEAMATGIAASANTYRLHVEFNADK